MRVAATGATADGEEPEQGRANGESGRDPGDSEGAGADVDLDVVRVKEGFKSTRESGVNNGSCQTGEEGENGGDLSQN